jgi:hypothetical protein
MENQTEIWQTEVNGQIYETDFAGLANWIAEGALLPQDKVRRGNLRWIEANKIPALYGFFNAKQLGVTTPLVATTTSGQDTLTPPPPTTFNNFAPAPASFNVPPPPNFYQELAPPASEINYCAIHRDAKASFHCETCANYFCKACPNFNNCPMCGALCRSINPPIVTPPHLAQPFSPHPAPVDFINDDVLKAANWFYWKAGLTVINSFIMMTGSLWAFFLGLGITQVFHGVAIGINQEVGEGPGRLFHGIALVLSLFCAGFVAMLGYFGRKGKRWALILGMLIFCFDAILYLVTFSIFGVVLHGFAIFMIYKGISAAKK